MTFPFHLLFYYSSLPLSCLHDSKYWHAKAYRLVAFVTYVTLVKFLRYLPLWKNPGAAPHPTPRE
jgi:hypothetical protein